MQTDPDAQRADRVRDETTSVVVEEVLTYGEAAQLLKVSARTLNAGLARASFRIFGYRNEEDGRAFVFRAISFSVGSGSGRSKIDDWQVQEQGRVLPQRHRVHPLPG
jgi:hypothetical protein